MAKLLGAVKALVADIRGETAWVEELNAHAQAIGGLIAGAATPELDEALRLLAGLFPSVPLVALGHVAISAGSLVERGGDPAILGPALLDKLPRIVETSGAFCTRCRTLALADADFIAQLRAEAAAGDDEEDDEPSDPAELTPEQLLDDAVVNGGWQPFAERFGPQLFKEDPAAVLGQLAEELFRLGLIAHLSRSKPQRAAARARPELLAGVKGVDELSGSQGSFLATMLQVLDDEPLLVLHVAQRKGYEVRIAGLADNFQLHTLLGGALIGKAKDGWLTGTAPKALAVAQCRDAQVESSGAPVTGPFNLSNWTALGSGGALAAGQGLDAGEHWIWNEGIPADILPFEGLRVVLLGEPPYARHWTAGRTFAGMVGELTVTRKLPPSEVADWLDRLAAAPRP